MCCCWISVIAVAFQCVIIMLLGFVAGAVVEGSEMVAANHVGVGAAVGVVAVGQGGRSPLISQLMNLTRNSIATMQMPCNLSKTGAVGNLLVSRSVLAMVAVQK